MTTHRISLAPRLLVLAIATALPVCGVSFAAQQPPPAPATAEPAAQAPPAGEQKGSPKPVYGTTSSVVLLDMIVRDKKGKPVRDLQPAEIKVSEDGSPRELTAFRLVEGQVSEDRVQGAAQGGLQPDPSRQVSLVTMVFDKVLDNRLLSRQAALDFVANNMESNVWISVWSIDQRLYLRQEFTHDPYLVKQAVIAATGTTSTAAASLAGAAAQQEEIAKEALSIAEQAQEAATATATSPSGVDASRIGANNAQKAMAQMIASTLRFSDSIQRQQQGQSSLYPLLALVKTQGLLAGRKTVLYFAEGLVVPKNLEEVFKTAISEANRANVTVYAIDARGLGAGRDSDRARDQLFKAARDSQVQMAKRGAGAVSVDEVMIAENAEESLRANVQSTLAELAQSTGGFLTADTNDFKPSMQRIATDIGSYYEAAYVPVSQEFDGRFRKISVKVTRPGVTVQSRSGYFALPPGEGSALLPFEMPLLTALTVDPAPHAFDYQVEALQFSQGKEGRQHVLLMEVPLQGMSFQVDKRKNTYTLRFSLLALVKDSTGRIVERFSDDYPFEGPLDKLDQIKRGNLIFRRPFALTPGEYTLESVAQDRDSGRTSVVRQPLRVLPAEGFGVSSITLVRRLEPAGPELALDDPFRLDRMRIVPNLDLPVSLATNAQLSLYLVAYARPGTAPPKMMIEFLRDDRIVARAKPELPAPDAEGRIPYVGTFPTATLPPGKYSVRAVVQQGDLVTETESPVTLVP
jgi:VWFA-related protein